MNAIKEFEVNRIVSACSNCTLLIWWKRNELRDHGQRCTSCFVKDIMIKNIIQKTGIPIEKAVELCENCLEHGIVHCHTCEHRQKIIHRLRKIETEVNNLGYELVNADKSCHCEWGRTGHSPFSCDFLNILEKL